MENRTELKNLIVNEYMAEIGGIQGELDRLRTTGGSDATPAKIDELQLALATRNQEMRSMIIRFELDRKEDMSNIKRLERLAKN